MKEAYIFDIDGTLLDISHRLVHIKNGKKDYKRFYEGLHLDATIWPVINILQSLKDKGYGILMSTGRKESCRPETIETLAKYFAMPDLLMMAPDKPNEPDFLVKQRHIEIFIKAGYNILGAFDDRSRVVDMWRANGIPCFQVAPGDY